MASSSSSREYQVFVSHAGEDKRTIAIPLRTMLCEQGITVFVDEKDIPPGGAATDEMTSAMDSADVAVILLSPEFVAKKWPMKELLFFLNRREKARANGESFPIIIPVFYRLSVAEMYREPNLARKGADGKRLYRATRFFERSDNGEPEADDDIIRSALRTLHGIMGVENKCHASNDASSAPSRLLLLKDICEKVVEALEECSRQNAENEEIVPARGTVDKFQPYFHDEPRRKVVLDFVTVDADGEPVTNEGRIRHRIINCADDSENMVAIVGGGGVGKSTILRSLSNDEDIREWFPDGVHLLSMGMDANDLSMFQELCRLMHDSGAEMTEEQQRKNMKERIQLAKDAEIIMRGGSQDSSQDSMKEAIQNAIREAIQDAMREVLSWFQGKECIFLIDDVWTSKISAQLFSQLFNILEGAGQQSAVVFTTREDEIASVAANVFGVTPREEQGVESRKILFCHAGLAENSIHDDTAAGSITEVLKFCNGLPVSLAAAGKSIKVLKIEIGSEGEDAWSEYLTTLGEYREQLLRANVGDYGNLYITFRASVSLLEGREEEKLSFDAPQSFSVMHRRLCVLRKPGRVPASILRHLWELRSEEEAKLIGMRFVEVGLAEVDYTRVEGRSIWHLAIHDSLHDFAVMEAKRNGDLLRAHGALLDGYIRTHPDLLFELEASTNTVSISSSKWGVFSEGWKATLEDSWYIHDNLIHHLKEVGLVVKLRLLTRTLLPRTISRALAYANTIMLVACLHRVYDLNDLMDTNFWTGLIHVIVVVTFLLLLMRLPLWTMVFILGEFRRCFNINHVGHESCCDYLCGKCRSRYMAVIISVILMMIVVMMSPVYMTSWSIA